MAKKTTLEDIVRLMEKGFTAVANDISEVRGDLARMQEQVNSIETELRYGRYEKRLGDLEDKVFGAPRR